MVAISLEKCFLAIDLFNFIVLVKRPFSIVKSSETIWNLLTFSNPCNCSLFAILSMSIRIRFRTFGAFINSPKSYIARPIKREKEGKEKNSNACNRSQTVFFGPSFQDFGVGVYDSHEISLVAIPTYEHISNVR